MCSDVDLHSQVNGCIESSASLAPSCLDRKVDVSVVPSGGGPKGFATPASSGISWARSLESWAEVGRSVAGRYDSVLESRAADAMLDEALDRARCFRLPPLPLMDCAQGARALPLC